MSSNDRSRRISHDSKERKEKLVQEIQDFLDSDRVSNIIDSSVSKDEAQAKIKNFLNG